MAKRKPKADYMMTSDAKTLAESLENHPIAEVIRKSRERKTADADKFDAEPLPPTPADAEAAVRAFERQRQDELNPPPKP